MTGGTSEELFSGIERVVVSRIGRAVVSGTGTGRVPTVCEGSYELKGRVGFSGTQNWNSSVEQFSPKLKFWDRRVDFWKRCVEFLGCRRVALVSFLVWWVPQKDAFSGFWIKFTTLGLVDVNESSTTKYFVWDWGDNSSGWICSEEDLAQCFKFVDPRRHSVDQEGGCEYCFTTELFRHVWAIMSEYATSIKCLFFLSATAFCFGVSMHELWCIMPFSRRYDPRMLW